VSTERNYIVWRLRSLTRQALILIALLALFSAPHAATSNAPAKNSAMAQAYFPEVRLRKLHLVRPDLIPYPIFYEVYC
jgi:hypothetical protein